MPRLVPAVVLLALLFTSRGGDADDRPRVQSHLRQVLHELRIRDVAYLAPDVRARRAAALDELARYTEAGVFPRRTGDAFEAYRPRFIDDRGVHCAVGQLIAASGHDALARSINARYEYAYVHDIAEPALIEWATTHGFTRDELARIQPTYRHMFGPNRVRKWLERKSQYTVQCLQHGPAPAELTLHVVADRSGRAKVTAQRKRPFDLCFAGLASRIRVGEGQPFSADISVRPVTPQQALANELKGAARPTNIESCTSRPGPIVRQVRLDAQTGTEGLRITATTTPANAEVSACFEQKARAFTSRFERITVPVAASYTFSIESSR